MKTITVELTEFEMANQMIPFWESERDKKLAEARALDAKIKRVREDLASTTHSGPVVQTTAPVERPTKTPHGRNRRGTSRRLIIQFLKTINAPGATIKAITAETGTVYGTARRILKQFETEAKVTVKDGLWRWNA